MQRTMGWLDHLRSVTEPGHDLAVYAQSWAHDVRCLRTGAAHRRVGLADAGHDEWLRAGFVTRSLSPQIG